ncbi:MAG: hypothetical protein R3246_17360, partial [Acidimicrobiia bacterium]|nr:hypothetical protein [Acidimicrobiia bacterium]
RATPEPVSSRLSEEQKLVAFLLGDDSRVALTNQRGSLEIALESGTCDEPSILFDGLVAQSATAANFPPTQSDPLPPSTWRVVGGTGGYAGAEGAGDFVLFADVSPGADNPFALVLDGDLAVVQPDLGIHMVRSYWWLGTPDYVNRRVTVIYEVTNVGAGHAYDVTLFEAVSATPGVSLANRNSATLFDNVPQLLGDLHPGETKQFMLQWVLPAPGNDPPCFLEILACQFASEITLFHWDALGIGAKTVQVVHATAPELPPALP